eukprot:1057354-Amphidinium_carterae.1
MSRLVELRQQKACCPKTSQSFARGKVCESMLASNIFYICTVAEDFARYSLGNSTVHVRSTLLCVVPVPFCVGLPPMQKASMACTVVPGSNTFSCAHPSIWDWLEVAIPWAQGSLSVHACFTLNCTIGARIID